MYLLATHLARAHAVLLLIRIKVAFKYLRTATLENPNAQVELMRCPTNASWEADIIVVSDNV
jgi:hypothetical protein